MPRFFWSAMNLTGILLVAIGVFLFANALADRDLTVGDFKFASGTDAGIFLIALGTILFALAFIAGKIFRKKS